MAEPANPEIGSSIEAAGLTTNYHDVGSGRPVVLIHGSGPGVTGWANWRLTIPVLAGQRRVLAPDITGFGYTDKTPDDRYDMDIWRTHLVGFLDALELQQVDVIPGDWIVTPPPHEKDQSATREARWAFAEFLKTYPESTWREPATKYLREVENALVRHEIYVARFYLHRDDRRAAVVRLAGIRFDYPESALVPDAMFLQALTYLEMNRRDKAVETFNEIIAHYPNHYQTLRARDYLKHLRRKEKEAKRGDDG